MIMSIGKGVAKGAAIVSVFALAGKLLGFVQKQVMAYYFGTGMEADAYTLAFGSLVFTIGLFPQQLLSPFLPLFMEKREKEGEPAAWRLAGTVGALLVASLLVTVGLGMWLAPQLAGFASKFDSAETTRLSARLVRAMMPAVLFMGLFSFCALLLHAGKRFARPAMAETFNKLLMIAGLIVLYRFWGIFGLAAGVVAGAAGGFLLAAGGLRPLARSVRLGVDVRDPALRRLAGLVGPILLGAVIAQIRTIIDNRFASGMAAGSVASLNYARGLTDTLVLLAPTAVGVALYPVFSDLAVSRNHVGLTDALMGAMRVMAFLFLPISAALIVLRTPLVQLVFQRGQFDATSVAQTTAPLLFYASGLTAFAIEIILMRFYFSMKNTLKPTVVGGACVLVHVAVILLFKEMFQHGSMALAATVSKTVKAAILFAGLRAFLPFLQGRRNGLFLAKSVAATAGMALAMVLALAVSERLLPVPGDGASKLMRLAAPAVKLGVAGLAGLAVYGALAALLKMEEVAAISRWVSRRLAAGRL